ncbi:MAG: hypothetical protein KGI33_01890 [Thaumarchaeota archaeon]|nr:hypothetical protein [Nitrososphaerota archaeon]
MKGSEEDEKSEILRGLFEEIMKMIRQKEIKIETIVQRSMEQGTITKESFMRIYSMLEQHGRERGWLGANHDSGQLAPQE